jgi:hypothetical protein
MGAGQFQQEALMVELKHDRLVISFPEVHRDAVLEIDFQRTLRIPDDDRDYPLPPGLGPFPLRHVDDFAERVPAPWLTRGGVLLPMYQSEALWLNFSSHYPFAVKVATGKINAVTGEPWADGLHRDPQDYMAVPDQPWLDGYCVEKGIIRQFVAMPLGAGYSVEEQVTGEAEHGGIQIVAYPLKREAYERLRRRREDMDGFVMSPMANYAPAAPDMGLAPGGRMRQEIYDDPHAFEDWDFRHRGRCFVHLANALVWRAITGDDPPTTPPTADEYNRAGLPWFEYYAADRKALEGGEGLKAIRSVAAMGKSKGEVPLPENESVTPERVITLRKGLGKHQVREGAF